MIDKSAIMIVPNTKEGLASLKYLASTIVKYDLLVKLITKKEFDLQIKLLGASK